MHSGYQSYHRPVGGGGAMSRSLEDRYHIPRSQYEPDISEEGETGVIAIGMAISSPANDQVNFTVPAWQPQVITTITATMDDKSEVTQEPRNGLVRTKSRKWGLFSRSKSKRGKDSDKSSQTQSNTQVSPSDGSSTPVRKPLGRSYTEPMIERQGMSQTNSAKTKFHSSPIAGNARQASSQKLDQNGYREPLLNVEIPDVTLERYSVMFASLLERRNTPSLLNRRQDTQDKMRARGLYDLREAGPGEPQTNERENSSFRDLPVRPPLRLEPLRINPTHTSSTRGRSNTSPAGFTPSRGKYFKPDYPSTGPSRSPIIRSASLKHSSPMADGAIENWGTRPLRSKFGNKHSAAQEPSPSKMTERSFDVYDRENEWNGVSPRSVSRSHSVAAANGRTPLTPYSSPSAIQSTPTRHADAPATQASLKSSVSSVSEEDEAREKAIESVAHDAVQVSIARQISVSRKQRRMLGPLQMNPAEGRRIADIKVLTPRLIPRDDPSSPVAAHRKSERIILETS